jgi:hypothetical protein
MTQLYTRQCSDCVQLRVEGSNDICLKYGELERELPMPLWCIGVPRNQIKKKKANKNDVR